MNVDIIRATHKPERLVCEAARNDYRSEGVAHQLFEDVMEDTDPDDKYLEDYSLIEAKKRTLLDHLMDHGHWGPFEHPQATVAIEGVSRVLMAQITRHRHFTFDIMSLRYVSIDEIETTQDIFDLYHVPDGLSDGELIDRDGVHEVDEEAWHTMTEAYEEASRYYQQLLSQDVPPEVARKVLPMGIKVNIVVSANSRAWMHILNVRTKGNVQSETRRCADAIFESLKEWMPHTFHRYDQDVLPLRLNP